jgi:hypothetical protein
MVFAGAGNLYVAEQNFGGIYVNGSPLDNPPPFCTGNPLFYNYDSNPTDLASDANGNLFGYFASMESSTGLVNGVVIEFGENGDDSVIATDIVGTGSDAGYIAVEPVPEPGIGTIVVVGFGVLYLGLRRKERRATARFRRQNIPL